MSATRHNVSGRIDLREVPFTLPLSRILILRDDVHREGSTAVSIHQVRYEVPLSECTIAVDLVVRDDTGASVQPRVVGASQLRWGENGPVLAVAPDDSVLISPAPPGWSVSWRPGVLTDGPSLTEVEQGPVERAVGEAEQSLDAWLARCPRVSQEHHQMAAFCWWVLGVNTLRLGGAVEGRAVVPSKLGYVGLWQWDAYFMAIGLRHGDVELAVEQLRIALAHQGADGQLPDVVHEAGVLASSDDLPPADLKTLRAHGSPALGLGRVPLTKPPLAALAIELVAEMAGQDLVVEMADPVARSQEWWFAQSDFDADGVPEYSHPYSSGLDDSPVFDVVVPLESPDLTAYLSLQDTILGGWADEAGDHDGAARHRARARRLRDRLAERLGRDGWVRPVGADDVATSLTIVSLLAVLAPEAPTKVTDGVLRLLTDPAEFGGATPAPTVSRSDPSFSPERMWRGPVWINTNWLLAHGLRLQGHDEEASALEQATLRLVLEGGGPAEYFNPDSRRRAATATRCFGWSAALFLDLAVRHAHL